MSDDTGARHPIQDNDAISLRVDLINASFELSEEDAGFIAFVGGALFKAADDIRKKAPATCDIGRMMAGTDALQRAKNTFCDAAILGKEADTRKKRKTETGSS